MEKRTKKKIGGTTTVSGSPEVLSSETILSVPAPIVTMASPTVVVPFTGANNILDDEKFEMAKVIEGLKAELSARPTASQFEVLVTEGETLKASGAKSTPSVPDDAIATAESLVATMATKTFTSIASMEVVPKDLHDALINLATLRGREEVRKECEAELKVEQASHNTTKGELAGERAKNVIFVAENARLISEILRINTIKVERKKSLLS